MSRPLTIGAVSSFVDTGFFLHGNGNIDFGQSGDNQSIFTYVPTYVGSGYASCSIGYSDSTAPHTVVIKTDGTLWGCGYTGFNTLTTQYTTTQYSLVQLGTGSDWKSVSTGYYGTSYIKNDNTVWINGASITQSASGSWKTIKEGYFANRMGIMSDDTVWGWGNSPYGQLGQNNILAYTSPVQFGSGSTWQVIDFMKHTMAIRSDGTLWACGLNTSGQLGVGDVVNRSSPVQVGTGSNWTYVSCGEAHTVALKTDGTLWSWGINNTHGQLGHNNWINRSSPVQIGTGSNWAYAIGGNHFSVALKTDGTLWSWGLNNINATGNYGNGVLGLGDANHRSSPVQIGTSSNWTNKINTVFYGCVAINSNNELYTWGCNQGGDRCRSLLFRSSPAQVSTTKWTHIRAGQNTSAVIPPLVVARKSNGTLWNWGALNVSTGFRSSPVQIGSKYDWTGIYDVGGIASYAIDTSNRLFFISNGTATQLGALADWKYVGMANRNGNGDTYTTAAIKTNSTLWTWGNNLTGELGNNSTVSTTSPVQLGTDTNWSASFGGEQHFIALKTDGTLCAWGLNTSGQLGIGDVVNRSSPVQIGTGSNWQTVSTNQLHTLALKTDGTLWAWGSNQYGQLGQNNTTNRSSPVQVGTDTTWRKIGAGYEYSYAIKSDGTLWAWGINNLNASIGNISGTPHTVTRSSPVQVGLLDGWESIATESTKFTAFLKS